MRKADRFEQDGLGSFKLDHVGSCFLQVTKFYNVEDSKLAFEVAHSFSDSSSYFWSYFFRTILELLTAIGLQVRQVHHDVPSMSMSLQYQVWIMFWGLPIIKENFFIHCDVHGTDYSCVGHPEEFYKYILFIAIAILFVYIFCCFFNLLWLFVPGKYNNKEPIRLTGYYP